MRRGLTGRYEATTTVGERVEAFVPAALPPHPPLDLSGDLNTLVERAALALGRLDSASVLLPDTALFLYSYVRKEAVLSSQIEGTQSSLSDLLLFEIEEAPGAPLDDVAEVSGYVRALEHGLARLRGGFPVSARLIKEMHAKLLERGRGSDRQPGEFRRSQNWIGGMRPGNAHFVPPPHTEVPSCNVSCARCPAGTTNLFSSPSLPVSARKYRVTKNVEAISPRATAAYRMVSRITFRRFLAFNRCRNT